MVRPGAGRVAAVQEPARHPGVVKPIPQQVQVTLSRADPSRSPVAAIRSMIGLAASPGTDVLPTCSIVLNSPGSAAMSSAIACLDSCGQAGSQPGPQEAAPATRLSAEAVDAVALALELELGGRVSAQTLRWAAVIALRTAIAVLDAEG